MLAIRKITENDLRKIEEMKLREADEQELRAATGLDPVSALLASIARANWSEAVIDEDGNFIAVYGVRTTGVRNELGVPWAVATNKALRHKKLLLRLFKKNVSRMLEEYSALCNFVDSRNLAHIRMLKYNGFKFPEGYEQECNGVEFLYFYKEKEKE